MSRWQSAQIAELERRDEWIPIRQQLGARAFGINAFVGDRAGDRVITQHQEGWRGHEELYLVVEGRATFTIDGDEIDAPAGRLVYVREPGSTRSAVAKEPGTVVVAIGGRPGAVFEPSDYEKLWPYLNPAFDHYRDGRYAEAAEAARHGVAEFPESAGLRYSLACFSSLAGDRGSALTELREAIRVEPRFRETARDDEDFATLRDDPELRSILA